MLHRVNHLIVVKGNVPLSRTETHHIQMFSTHLTAQDDTKACGTFIFSIQVHHHWQMQ